MTRSKEAFLWSVKGLGEYAEREREKLYFWRFSFACDLHDWQYGYRFARFMYQIVRRYEGEMPLYGVRVLERTKRGRIHEHAIVNKRIPIDLVHRLGRRYDLGWAWVKTCWEVKGAGNYLGKYLSKRQPVPLPRGMKKWSCIGGFQGTRVKSIERESAVSEALGIVRQWWVGGRIGYGDMQTVLASPILHFPRYIEWACRYAAADRGDYNVFRWPMWKIQQEAGCLYGEDLAGVEHNLE